ncbi:hypothetical protein VTK73DRAFT_9703 [Phialemonium thermophilum]|uniref:Uncharacterized protein n=1 Tax=Phialemonium thermophilum TaxID=223376 RepID=A0ABR3W0S6_9PEZI
MGDSAVKAGIKLLPLLISVVITSILSGGLTTAIGYYNPFVLPSMVLFAVGAGMISTFAIHSPPRVWFGYQVLCGKKDSTTIPLFSARLYPRQALTGVLPRSRNWRWIPDRTPGRAEYSVQGVDPGGHSMRPAVPESGRGHLHWRLPGPVPERPD